MLLYMKKMLLNVGKLFNLSQWQILKLTNLLKLDLHLDYSYYLNYVLPPSY